MLIPFLKMQAQGNDFVILDAFGVPQKVIDRIDFPALTKDACKPKTGIGADGFVLLLPSKATDGQMIIYNADGSRAEMCGSALRCVALLLKGKKKRGDLSITTDSGIKSAIVGNDNQVTVNLGIPKLLQQNLQVGDFYGDLVDIGNLHFIVWSDDLESDPHLRFGSILEIDPAFPRPVNVHFVRKLSEDSLQMKIWERAVGATQACGTGAASCVCSAVSRELDSERVVVAMPGGEVSIKPGSHGYLLSGEVNIVFSGEYEWKT